MKDRWVGSKGRKETKRTEKREEGDGWGETGMERWWEEGRPEAGRRREGKKPRGQERKGRETSPRVGKDRMGGGGRVNRKLRGG